MGHVALGALTSAEHLHPHCGGFFRDSLGFAELRNMRTPSLSRVAWLGFEVFSFGAKPPGEAHVARDRPAREKRRHLGFEHVRSRSHRHRPV